MRITPTRPWRRVQRRVDACGATGDRPQRGVERGIQLPCRGRRLDVAHLRHDDGVVASETAHALTAVIVLGAVASPFAHDTQWTGLVQRLRYLAISARLLLAWSTATVRR